ncbi:MAG: nuclear transport factor 2 family protein [Pseudomonadota bacterium]
MDTPQDISQEDALVAQLQPLFDDWVRFFAVNDFDGVRSLWVADLERPFYMAEEHDVLMSSWPEVEHYWAETAKINTDFQGKIEIVNAKYVSDIQAMVQFQLGWKMSLVGWERPIGGTNRGMAGFEKTKNGWKFHSYIEAPKAPITYLREYGASDETMGAIKTLYMDVAEGLSFPKRP